MRLFPSALRSLFAANIMEWRPRVAAIWHLGAVLGYLGALVQQRLTALNGPSQLHFALPAISVKRVIKRVIVLRSISAYHAHWMAVSRRMELTPSPVSLALLWRIPARFERCSVWTISIDFCCSYDFCDVSLHPP